MSYSFHGIRLPDDTQDSIDRYVNAGIPTGGFLEAVIGNDLREACGRADEVHMRCIPAIVAYLYNNCPSLCWGSPERYREWIYRKSEERRKAALEAKEAPEKKS